MAFDWCSCPCGYTSTRASELVAHGLNPRLDGSQCEYPYHFGWTMRVQRTSILQFRFFLGTLLRLYELVSLSAIRARRADHPMTNFKAVILA